MRQVKLSSIIFLKILSDSSSFQLHHGPKIHKSVFLFVFHVSKFLKEVNVLYKKKKKSNIVLDKIPAYFT